jgi:hypothetical protein
VHPARRTAIGGLLIAIAVGRPLGAQDRAVVELGASVMRFPADSLETVGPTARASLARERGPLAVSGTVAALAGHGGASGFLDLSGRWLTSLAGGWRSELGGDAGALVGMGTRASSYASSAQIAARLLHLIDAGGIWLRGNGSLGQRQPDLLSGRGIGAGGWWRWPGVQVVASLEREWTTAQLFTGPQRQGYAGRVPVAYAEGTVAVQAERDDVLLSLSGTIRRDPGAEHLVERGVSATLARWQTPTRAFVVSIASQLPDFVRGADAAQSFTVGIRLNEPSPAATRALRARPIIQVSGDAEARTVRVRAPGARRVEIMGDFSGWEPVELAPTGEVFSATVSIPSGTRRIVVRVDGGAWAPAANTPAVDDDFGGRVGLLLVP